MKMTDHKPQKNLFFLQLFFMIVMMFLVTAVAAIFFCNSVITSFYRDCEAFDMIMDSVAVMSQRQISYQRDILQDYGEVLYHAGDETPQEIVDRLEQLDTKSFEALVWLEENADAHSTQEVTLSKDEAERALTYLREHPEDGRGLYLGRSGDSMAFYVIPCQLSNGTQGALAGIVSAQVNVAYFSGELETEKSSLYLLNEKQETMLYGGEGSLDFQYDNLERRFFFDDSFTALEQVKVLLGEWQTLGQAGITTKMEMVERLLEGRESIWYEKPVRVQNGTVWKLVVCRAAVLSEDSAIVIYGSVIMVAFVILFFFVLMLGQIISQGNSSRKLRSVAYYDIVTGKHNWSWFRLEAERLCRRKRRKEEYIMVSMDIRRFRVISDMDGEMRSDNLLRQTAETLQGQIGKKECFARFSVDEFALLLCCGSEEEAKKIVCSIDASLKSQQLLSGIEFCYGIYFINDYEMPVHKMYNYAGIARDCIKNSHESFIGIFNESMREGLVREKELENRMESAMKQREFLVYLQPKYSADGSCIGGAEALVRWKSEDLGFLSPAEFIPLFEKNGFIIRLDLYMLRSICELQACWQSCGKELITISVNISRAHLMDPALVQGIINLTDAYGIPHSCIELEITESAFFEDKDMLFQIVTRLKEAGFSVSMDDFGSGYSSLNSLKDLPLDVIKLDGEFFRYGDNKERSETVIRDTVSMAKHLNMTMIAEGIETKEQVEFLQHIGCDYIQGYYFAKPMPVREFEQLMGYQEPQQTPS